MATTAADNQPRAADSTRDFQLKIDIGWIREY
jgi:hypothetical protein